jgi:cytochrome c553
MRVLLLSILAGASVALMTGPAFAGGDAAAGKAKSEACADCHGEDGKGDDETPKLVGLSTADFTKAMEEYASGARKAPTMNKAAKKLSAGDIADLAAYYATLK